MTPEQHAAIAQQLGVPSPCHAHPWAEAMTVSRYDDRTPLCALCWDAERAGMSVLEYGRHVREQGG